MTPRQRHRLAFVLCTLSLTTTSLSGLDLSVHTQWFRHSHAGALTVAQALAAASGFFLGVGVILLLGLLFASVFLERHLSQDEDDPRHDFGVSHLLHVTLGAAGTRWWTLPFWLVLLVGLNTASQHIFFTYFSSSYQIPRLVSILYGTAIGLGLTLLSYRILAWKKPSWALPRALVLTSITGYLFHFIDSTIYYIKPDAMWLFSLLLLATFTFTAAALISEYRLHLRTWPSRALMALSVLPLLGLLGHVSWYNSSPALHSYLSTNTHFYPALLVSVGPLFDSDVDGQASVLGFGDCDDTNPDISPEQMEVPGNGIDENCRGGDLPALPSTPHTVHPKRTDPDSPLPNIILITVDALRHDMPFHEVKGKPLMPSVQSLAAESVVYDRAYAPSTHTTESMIGLMTGRYPTTWWQHGLRFGARQSIATLLREMGYETRAVSTIFSMNPDLGLGFNTLDMELSKVTHMGNTITSAETTKRAIAQIQQRDASKPLFLWVHYFDPHAAYLARAELTPWLGDESNWQRYHHDVYDTDRAIGVLLKGLRAAPAWKDTVVMLTGDHGDAFDEHYNQGHLWTTYEEVIRVPLLMKLPGVSPHKVTTPTSLLSVHPTLMEHVGISGFIPRPEPSMLQALKAQREPEARPVFVEAGYPTPLFFVTLDSGWKLSYDRRYNAYSLYDLTTDPQELNNLISSEPEQFQRLKALMGTWRDQTYNTTKYERLAESYRRLDAKKAPRN